MTLTIDLNPELESRLRDEAARSGMAPDAYLKEALEQKLRQNPPDPRRLPAAESELLVKIDSAPEGLDFNRYHALLARNRDETILPAEHAELIEMIHAVEKANAKRIEYLIELAGLRGVSLDDLLESLSISPPPVE